MPSSRASVWNAVERLVVGRVVRTRRARLAQPRVLGADRGVVEAGRHRMRRLDVAVLVLQHERARALQHAGDAAREARGVTARRDRLAAGLDADQPHLRVVDERIEDADRVAAAADARDHRVRQAPGLLEDLRARLAADHRLELAHHQRIRMRAERRPEQVVRVARRRHPVAHRLVDRVLQRAAAGIHALRPRRRAGACGTR